MREQEVPPKLPFPPTDLLSEVASLIEDSYCFPKYKLYLCLVVCVHLKWYGMLTLFPGVLGIKVKIMLPHDATGKSGPKKPLPDQVEKNFHTELSFQHCLDHLQFSILQVMRNC